jgi:hypothetical protein
METKMKTADVSLYCPAMKVTRNGMGSATTAAEPMTAIVTFDDKSTLTLTEVVIPPTLVKRLHLLHWQVEACVGAGKLPDGTNIRVALPPEDVIFSLADMTMVAQAIDAQCRLELPGGKVGQGIVRFPDCKMDLLTGTAQAVTAVGSLEF